MTRKPPLPMLLVRRVRPLPSLRLHLTLSDGTEVERDLSKLIRGGVFEPIRRSVRLFRRVRVYGGTLAWPGNVALCPDVVIWGGAPPDDPAARPPAFLKIDPWWRSPDWGRAVPRRTTARRKARAK